MGSLRQIKSSASRDSKGPVPGYEWEEGEYRLSLVTLSHMNEHYNNLTFYNIFLILRKGNAALTDFDCLTIYRYEDTIIDTLNKKFAEEEMEKVIQKSVRGGSKEIGFPREWTKLCGDSETTVLAGLMR
jgi:hypothetical protein